MFANQETVLCLGVVVLGWPDVLLDPKLCKNLMDYVLIRPRMPARTSSGDLQCSRKIFKHLRWRTQAACTLIAEVQNLRTALMSTALAIANAML